MIMTLMEIAVNSHHVVPKIRCVASALLDMTVDSFDPMGLATWRLPESSRDEAASYLGRLHPEDPAETLQPSSSLFSARSRLPVHCQRTQKYEKDGH